jgi:signal recognition particle GTPase
MSNQPSEHEFDLNDFRRQIAQMEAGLVRQVMGKIPGFSQMAANLNADDVEGEVRRILGMIDSMTPAERRHPHLIDVPRRRRIAGGAGVSSADVSGLIGQFDAITAMIKQVDERAAIGPTPLRRVRQPHTRRPVAVAPAAVDEGWPSASDRLKWFPIWNRNLMLWEFVADS